MGMNIQLCVFVSYFNMMVFGASEDNILSIT